MDNCGNIFFLIIGILMFINSPYLVRFSKKNNSVTQEHKFIWDREYKITKLCKITDIKEVKKEKFNPFIKRVAMLILKNGKEISIFPIIIRSNARNVQNDVEEIKSYLNDSDKCIGDLILKESIYRIMGIIFIAVGILALHSN